MRLSGALAPVFDRSTHRPEDPMDQSRYVVRIHPEQGGWWVTRPEWSPLRYLREQGALENAELMAKLHCLTTGQPSGVVLNTAEGERVVRRYG
ncbi:hypothetical protein XVE_5041 [Xanthomonas vesicatoria ATCC 35937]|uniref:Uncharacterized protein n=2 Tax=Xanthomonas vesicatoria TaxID=56460 RepID=F0BL69_9XANT|nr:hypothetical protein XVE_5041 [Xanthomonas vesicatoria ATCC 35937]